MLVLEFNDDQTRDAFIPKKPYNSWVLNEQTCLWESPIAVSYGWTKIPME
jgi:hypothetical protein